MLSTRESGGSRESGLPAKGNIPQTRTFSTPPSRMRARISPHSALPGFRRDGRESRARTGGIPMDQGGGKRMDPAIHIPPAADAALSARSELLKNKINIDKFTGFFDKFLEIIDYASGCNQKSYHINLSVPHSDMAQKNFKSPHLPAFAMNRARFRAFPRKFSIPRIPCPARGRVPKNRDGFSRRNEG